MAGEKDLSGSTPENSNYDNEMSRVPDLARPHQERIEAIAIVARGLWSDEHKINGDEVREERRSRVTTEDVAVDYSSLEGFEGGADPRISAVTGPAIDKVAKQLLKRRREAKG